MTDRAVSTVVDLAVCLLLVGAAVLTLAGAPSPAPDPAAGRAEETATTLATSTAAVSYDTRGGTATTRGTLAGLLADAARSNATPTTGRAFRLAVGNATRPVLGGPDWRATVVASWRPYRGSEPAGTVRVGPAPPPTADVYAATTTVPSGLAPVRAEARAAAGSDGYRGVARVVARAAGDRALDRSRTGLAADLRQRYDAPTAAAAAVRVGSVEVAVGAWSP